MTVLRVVWAAGAVTLAAAFAHLRNHTRRTR